MLSYPMWPQLGPLWVSGHQHQLTYAKDRELGAWGESMCEQPLALDPG